MIRILIVDDQTLVREGIKILLDKATEIDIIDDAEDGNSALEKIADLQPDIVLLDIAMPGIDGLAVAEQIRTQFPQVKIIMLSSHDDPEYVRKSTQSGAKGYLLKSASSQELEWSIKLVYQGYSTIKSELLDGQILDNNSLQEPDVITKPLSDFSPLKKEIPLSDSVPIKQEIPQVRRNSQNSSLSNNNAHVYIHPDSAISVIPEKEQANLAKLELLLAKNSVGQKYSSYRQQRRKNPIFNIHSVRISQIKKTMMSFEFKLLVFIILFSLGFLVFIALS